MATNSPAKGPALVVGEATQARIALLAGVFGRTPRVGRAIASSRSRPADGPIATTIARADSAVIEIGHISSPSGFPEREWRRPECGWNSRRAMFDNFKLSQLLAGERRNRRWRDILPARCERERQPAGQSK